jgi:hypothetical protein
VKAGVEVLGVSTDPVESHKKFCEELKLPFSLLSDEGGKVSKLFGILLTTPKGDLLSGRSVFLLDKEGIVRHADAKYDLKPADDHDALLKAVKGLGGVPSEKSKGSDSSDAKGDGARAEGAKASGASDTSGAGAGAGHGAQAAGAKRIAPPKIEGLVFGRITVEGKEHTNDVIIDRGKVRERDKKPSRAERAKYGGHTPLTPKEEIPWECKTLLIGIGMSGRLPVVEELKAEAKKRGVKLILKKTPEAVEYLRDHYEEGMNAILHITC